MNHLGEQVIVSAGDMHYLPDFKNPIYELAVQHKLALRNEALMRIKSGIFQNGLAPLLGVVGKLTREEYITIVQSWFDNGQEDLIAQYRNALELGDIATIEQVDSLLSGKTIESGGRK